MSEKQVHESVRLEQAVLRFLRDKRNNEGLRRVSLEDVMSLPEVQKYYPENPPEGTIPDELVRCLSELDDDGLVALHRISFLQTLGGKWHCEEGPNPQVQITLAGETEIRDDL